MGKSKKFPKYKIFKAEAIKDAIRNLTVGDVKLPLFKSAIITVEYFEAKQLYTTYPFHEDNVKEKEEISDLFYHILLETSLDVSADCLGLKVRKKFFPPPIVEVHKNNPVLVGGYYNIYWSLEEGRATRVPCITVKNFNYIPPDFYYKPIPLPDSFYQLVITKFEVNKAGTKRHLQIKF